MTIEVNVLETKRFGILAAHVIDSTASPETIDSAARNKGVKMLTVRIPAPDLPRVHAFEAAGYLLMDTLVYYTRKLGELPPRSPPPNGISFRHAASEDADQVANVAQAGFAGYMGHYHADPRLDLGAADAAYVEWAETSTARISSAAPVLVAENGDGIVGFLTLRSNNSEEMEIVLNAVEPASHGQGIYGMLVGEALALAESRGFSRVVTSTQINNYTVQRVWSQLGFYHSRSLYTFHKWL
ncbi:GNAT family N-acetyltransferase [Minwuia thermotolerans]|uniref:N-acetyltransferase domain-containing protein n=1 Tax=Minwuia thermotolerans TaxID=2056226 RepID=A0A2M9FV76_9PROT|nr:GNAT family N-acetyltransferase [Minwuia thermotolerans]PJK27365.1 hypothetical protein CVT23_22605 [Minwuia thermotolerans]